MSNHVLLSPAELAYLHASLSLLPPLRPDGRSPNKFRPVTAETSVLPGANGSARVCFADGTEAIVGVKAEVEKTRTRLGLDPEAEEGGFDAGAAAADDDDEGTDKDDDGRKGHSDWVEMTVEIPGQRDDEAGTVFLAAMLSEALLADGEFVKRLYINRRFHWKLYLDILLISPPLSYPLPLLSLTTHLALLATRLPRLKSEGDEDPLFDDDWAVADYLYPRVAGKAVSRPPLTLLVMAVGNNIIFDPAKEELAVADVALAVSVGEAIPASSLSSTKAGGSSKRMEIDTGISGGRNLRLLSVRTIDPPSRLTPPGVPNEKNSAYGAAGAAGPTAAATAAVTTKTQKQAEARTAETESVEGVWKAPRGGAKVLVMAALVDKCLERGGVADEVFDALEAIE
ncbi:ribosomal protein S5 domain 2-type protein [Coniochaeta sp. 2T2.1]|nr:ribosomal protein S5 domain 2-type protein [Coniochaeta sp. 2T2.1]